MGQVCHGEGDGVGRVVDVVADDSRCVVIDAARDTAAILSSVGDRTVRVTLLTQAHDDHLGAHHRRGDPAPR
jgi:glyoxylase-like metal-dependent hydrolase (beta-lactamase superfamily II)